MAANKRRAQSAKGKTTRKKALAPSRKVTAARKKPAPAPRKKTASKRPARKSAGQQVLDAAKAQGLMARLSPPVQPMVERLRALFLESAPEAVELFEASSASYFAQGVFARIEPQDRAVIVRFLRGDELPSAAELSPGGAGRSLMVSSVDELRTDVLRKLVREAVMINLKLAQG